MNELERARICSRIAQARHEAGYTQEEMADLLGIKIRTYQYYEDDRVPYRRIRDISEATGRSEQWLLHGFDPASSQREQEDRLDRVEFVLGQVLEELRALRSERGSSGAPEAEE